MDEPKIITDLKAKLAKTESQVEERRKRLHLDDVFTFRSKTDQFSDRPLRFRKLRFGESVQVQGMMPNIPLPPEDATDEVMVKWWNDIDSKDKLLIHEAMATALALATKDSYGIQEFRDLEGPLVIEVYQYLMDVSGISTAAIDDFAWFRGKAGGSNPR